MRGIVLVILGLSFGSNCISFADDVKSSNDVNYDNMSIEDLMNIQVSVASNKPTTINESPGIVTLVTADEIAHMGARDLTDVLLQVPGFYLSTTGYGTDLPNIRGLQADAGKILFLIDGQEMNERLFQTTPMGRRYPINMIDKIEIIRGPGSVKYGGTAGLCVIKVTTKLAAARRSAASLETGRQEYGSPENRIEGMYDHHGETVSGGALVSWNGSAQSEQNETDTTGNTKSMLDNSQIDDKFGEILFNDKNFSFQAMYDSYVQRDFTTYGVNLTEPVPNRFNTVALTARYSYNVSPNLSIRPYVNYERDIPWQATELIEMTEENFVYYRALNHYELGIDAYYDPNSNVSWLFGLMGYEDNAVDYDGIPFNRDSVYSVRFYYKAAYTELNYHFNWAELTAGVRYDSGPSGDSLVPRLALVKDYKKWGYKALWTEAFRDPGVENIEDGAPSSPAIKPETVHVAELELNGKIGEHSAGAINFFLMTVSDSIVFYELVTPQNPQGNNYENANQLGTKGLEAIYQYRDSNNLLKASFSYSLPDGNVAVREVPGYSQDFFGNENWKATLLDTVRVWGDSYYVTPTVVYEGPRYSQEWSNAAATNVFTQLPSTFYVNLVLEDKNFIKKDWDLSFGVYNISNTNYRLAETTINSGEALPTQSREYLLKMNAVF